ncbi:MAG: ThuA domain-containing protein [Clostridia bacterium]|nr:ThuA domain-containing protein [Clostridia bacterium]
MKKALIFYGGWNGHQPELVSARFQRLLEKNGYAVERYDNMECLADREKLLEYDLLVSAVTMSELPRDYEKNVSFAVSRGVGLAGCHGGMCDSFRKSVEWQFITGGQWVSHPGGDGITYKVNVHHGSSPITEGLSDFDVTSEHYYLHIDPAIEVLASTRFPLVNYYHAANKPVDMPVAWTKYWGLGRVFYCSLGHHDDVFDNSPTAEVLMERGMLWAGDGKQFATQNDLDPAGFDNTAKMY